jgi:hypothetical protein
MLGHEIGEARAVRLVAERLDRDQRNSLQRNAALPFGAHCRQRGPGNLALRTNAVDMGAYCPRAVRIRAA